jgi:hypothetical protein
LGLGFLGLGGITGCRSIDIGRYWVVCVHLRDIPAEGDRFWVSECLLFEDSGFPGRGLPGYYDQLSFHHFLSEILLEIIGPRRLTTKIQKLSSKKLRFN